MTKLFDDVIADARALPAEEQDRVANALLLFINQLQDDEWRLI
jgi:hypothetical protein